MAERWNVVVQRFPEHEQRILELIDSDSDFEELCQDYENIADAIAVGTASQDGEPDAIQRELLRLRSDLEGDILAELS